MLKECFFEICCSHPCFKEKQVQSFEEHGSQNACQQFISSCFFFFERERFLYQKFFYSFCLPFYLDSSKARIETAWTEQRGHLTRCAIKCDLCLLCMLYKFYYFKHKHGLALSLAWTWGLDPTNLKSFLQGLVHKRHASKVYGSITPKFINQNFDTMPHFD